MTEVIDFGSSEFVHLGLGGTIAPLPRQTGDMSWYAEYGARHGADGDDGRLVSLHTFTESWDSWEVHPHGEELVLCLAGSITLHQEHLDGSTEVVTLTPSQAVVNPPGTWHTADVPHGVATALFITSGRGTDHRPR